MAVRVTTTDNGILIGVKVQPRARRSAVGREWNGLLKVAVTEIPEGGRANRAVEELVAQWLGVPKSAVEVVRGHSSRHKMLRIDGITTADLGSQLTNAGNDDR